MKDLFRPVDAASLVFLRVSFGLIMLVECFRFWRHGWIDRYYIEPDFLFKYYGFEWVHPWPGDGMYWHFVALAVLSLMVAAGLFYRLAMILFALAFSYVFLLEQARYLNHFYLVIVLAFLMILVPASRTCSVDAWLRSRDLRTVPMWSIWLIRAQFELVYVFAGIVKVNGDWLRLEPLGMWLARRGEFPLIGNLFTEDWLVAIASYGVIALHLIGAPLLLIRRARIYVVAVYFVFHLMNHFLFQIGIFPWLTMAATMIFFDPDWPRQIWRWLNKRLRRLVPSQGFVIRSDIAPSGVPSGNMQVALLGFFIVWFGFQILFPLRHLLYPGNPSWTEEGRRFAWQMKLRDKRARAFFTVHDPATGGEWEIRPDDLLLPHQARKVAGRPELILQYAHYIARHFAERRGTDDVEVRAWICASLNGRPAALLIDPERDLAQVERGMRHADWILPLQQPFERPPFGRRRLSLSCERGAIGDEIAKR